MTLEELVRFLPMTMPADLELKVGDTVYVRLDRCKHQLHKGLITGMLDAEGDAVEEVEITPDASVRIDVETDDVTYRVVPFRDALYTPVWINQYAGDAIVEEEVLHPKPKMARRFQRLVEQ